MVKHKEGNLQEATMDQNNLQQEIAIVRQIIEKSRRETAESGWRLSQRECSRHW